MPPSCEHKGVVDRLAHRPFGRCLPNSAGGARASAQRGHATADAGGVHVDIPLVVSASS